MEELRKDPERYLRQMDVPIFDSQKPDLSIMEDNQIIDMVIDQGMKDIEHLVRAEHQKT